MYIKETGFGYSVFLKGKLLAEFLLLEEAQEYIIERKAK